MTLKVGIVSANWGAFAHLPAWRAVPGVEVTSICTSRPETAEAARARLGLARAFSDVRAMAADPELDIIDCGTRPSFREWMVEACLQGGKHVYNAIPFAAGIEGARKLRDAWKASGKVGVVDAYSEWLPAHRLAGEMLKDGFIGQPFGGTCTFTMSLFNQLMPQFPYNWFAEAGHGVSAVRNLGSHALHMLVHLFGPIAELVADDRRLLDQWRSPDGSTVVEARTNDFAALTARFESGLVMQVQISWNAPLGRGWSLDVFGAEGRIAIEAPSFPTPLDTTLRAGRLGGAMEAVAIPERLLKDPAVALDATAQVAPAYGMALSMNGMVRAIAGGSAPHPDFEQAYQVERALEAVRRSSEERRWVRLDEIP